MDHPAAQSAATRLQARMIAKIAVLAAAALALTPVLASAVWPSNLGANDLARTVELNAQIIGFTQSRDRIQVRLAPAADVVRQRVVVREVGARHELLIPLKRGQTWATAKLPQALADAAALEISVQ